MTDYPKAIWSPSPNFWVGREGLHISAIVLHRTAGQMPGCLDTLKGTNETGPASAHYLVTFGGDVYQLVAEDNTAWHAGIVPAGSPFYGGANPNLWTIGIEHEANQYNNNVMPSAQLAASAALVRDIQTRRGTLQLLMHSDIFPGDTCPGPNFPYSTIKAAGTPNGFRAVHFTADVAVYPLPFYPGTRLNGRLYLSNAKAGQPVQFDGWQYGEPVWDEAAGALDNRWYRRYNPKGQTGWVPSAFVNGNAPNSTPRP